MVQKQFKPWDVVKHVNGLTGLVTEVKEGGKEVYITFWKEQDALYPEINVWTPSLFNQLEIIDTLPGVLDTQPVSVVGLLEQMKTVTCIEGVVEIELSPEELETLETSVEMGVAARNMGDA